jgi:hypothetical protein
MIATNDIKSTMTGMERALLITSARKERMAEYMAYLAYTPWTSMKE